MQPRAHSRRFGPGILLSGALLVVLLTGCGHPEAGPRLGNWLLRSSMRASNVPAAVDAAVPAVQAALENACAVTGLLEPGYPQTGWIRLTPLEGTPGASTISCETGEKAPRDGDAPPVACLLLASDGSLAQIRPITWQSAAAFQYRLYLRPRSLLEGPPLRPVDTTRDFVAVDLYTIERHDLALPLHRAVASALESLGAERLP